MGNSSVRNTCMESWEKPMSYMHTYEYECKCGYKVKMEIHNKLDKHKNKCVCGQNMDLNFYMRSPDTRGI